MPTIEPPNMEQAIPLDAAGAVSVCWDDFEEHVVLAYRGMAADLIAAGVMAAAWTEPTGKRLSTPDGVGARVTRQWRTVGGVPQRWCKVEYSGTADQLIAMPGAVAARRIGFRFAEWVQRRDQYDAEVSALTEWQECRPGLLH